MKKIFLLSMVILASASFNTAFAGKKKDKKNKEQQEVVEQVVEPVILATATDSLSYAAGKTATDGLIPYLQQQLHVDTAYMADFAKGFEEAFAKVDDPKYAAYMAGSQIAQMAKQRILPSMQNNFEGSDIKLSEDLFNKGFIASLKKDNSIYPDSVARKVNHIHALLGYLWYEIVLCRTREISHVAPFVARPYACAPYFHVRVDVSGIDGICDANRVVPPHQFLYVARIALRPVTDEDFADVDANAPRKVIVFHDGFAQEFISLYRTVTMEARLPRHFVHRPMHRLYHCRTKRLGYVAHS